MAASVWNYFRAWTLLPTEFTYPALYSYTVAAGLWFAHALGWGPKLDAVAETLTLVSYLDPARSGLVGRAITNVANERRKMGAVQNRLDVTELSRGQILLQSSNAMLLQANASSVAALSLL